MGKKSRNPRKNNKKKFAMSDQQINTFADKKSKINDVHIKAMSQLKLAKSKLKEFIIYKNKHKIKLDPKPTKHLKLLIELWNNDEDADIEYYFNMKNHTTQINGQIKNEALTKLWRNYIETICGARCVLLEFNHLVN